MDRRRTVESQLCLAVLLVVTRAGPPPIGRSIAESSADRVLVDVGDGGLDGLHRREVPIVAPAFLPETEASDSEPFMAPCMGIRDSAIMDRAGCCDAEDEPREPNSIAADPGSRFVDSRVP